MNCARCGASVELGKFVCPACGSAELEASIDLGTGVKEARWEEDWLAFTDHEYYHRCRSIMLSYGMGEGDVEMILANLWESGWIAGNRAGCDK